MKTKPTIFQLEAFLKAVDTSFPVPLSQKQDLTAYAHKLHAQATVCAFLENGEILSMVAGYTDNLKDGLAYIAIAATLDCARGRGLASAMIKEFLSVCASKNVRAVHLYAVPTNIPAIKMYQKLGFLPWALKDEPRPDDAHLVYCLKEQTI